MARTWEQMGAKIFGDQERGHCWRCNTNGHRLGLDPMGSAKDTRVLALCSKCRSERSQISDLYRRLGRYIQPQRNTEPIA